MAVYDINGNILADMSNTFADNMELDYEFDADSNANYTVLRIYKNRIDGREQFPFVYVPNGTGAGTKSTLEMNLQKNFYVAINGGIFYTDTANKNKPRALVIQNGVLIQQGVSDSRVYPLTIDANGDLGYAQPDADGTTLISQGIISAVSGWAPIIIDYDDALIVIPGAMDDPTVNAQRQIIGQFGNGDYAIITCEGRNYDHSDGWTYTEAKNICKKLGLKFAYNLDGGGSTETVIGKKQINTIYEGTYGRVVPTYIVFNGTDTFTA